MTIPIGGVWRPGDSDNEEEEANFFFGDSKPSESKTSNKGKIPCVSEIRTNLTLVA